MSVQVQALAEHAGPGPSLFLAGGITDCGDWQADLARCLADLPLVLLNPRRESIADDPAAASTQIEWEHRHLRRATAILFWFPPETLCPITLYELGTWSQTAKPLFVGTHPDYRRKLDVQVQTRLARPDVAVVECVDQLVEQVRAWTEQTAGAG